MNAYNEDAVGGFQKTTRSKPRREPKGRKDKNDRRGSAKRTMM